MKLWGRGLERSVFYEFFEGQRVTEVSSAALLPEKLPLVLLLVAGRSNCPRHMSCCGELTVWSYRIGLVMKMISSTFLPV